MARGRGRARPCGRNRRRAPPLLHRARQALLVGRIRDDAEYAAVLRRRQPERPIDRVGVAAVVGRAARVSHSSVTTRSRARGNARAARPSMMKVDRPCASCPVTTRRTGFDIGCLRGDGEKEPTLPHLAARRIDHLAQSAKAGRNGRREARALPRPARASRTRALPTAPPVGAISRRGLPLRARQQVDGRRSGGNDIAKASSKRIISMFLHPRARSRRSRAARGFRPKAFGARAGHGSQPAGHVIDEEESTPAGELCELGKSEFLDGPAAVADRRGAAAERTAANGSSGRRASPS